MRNNININVFSTQETVSHDFFQIVADAIEQRIPVLPQHIPFTVKQLCGEQFWNSLSDGDKRTAGGYVSYMVNQQVLPLIDTGRNSSNSKVYQINPLSENRNRIFYV